MSKKKRLLPFGWLPGHWGLAGKTRERAQAEYEFAQGYELDAMLIRIDNPDDSSFAKALVELRLRYGLITEQECDYSLHDLTYFLGSEEAKLSLLKLDKKYNKIEEEDYQRKLAELTITDEKLLKMRLLELDKKYEKITHDEFEKKKATLLEEPYVRIAKIETDPTNPAYGGIIMDWNKAFVQQLEDAGYGPDPDEARIVEQWFNELCRNIATEAFDGVGDFNEKMAAGNVPHHRRNLHDDVILKKPTQPKQDDTSAEE